MALLAVRPLGLDRTIEGPIAVPFLWTPFLIACSPADFLRSQR